MTEPCPSHSQSSHAPSSYQVAFLSFSSTVFPWFFGSMMQFRINEYGTLKVVSTDKIPPVEAIKEGHTEKDGDSEVAPTSRDNPTVAQGKGTVVALLGWVLSTSRCYLAQAPSKANVS